MRKLELLLKFSQLDAISKKEEEEEEEEFEAFSLHYFPKLLINILIVNATEGTLSRKRQSDYFSDSKLLSISYFKAKKNERREKETERSSPSNQNKSPISLYPSQIIFFVILEECRKAGTRAITSYRLKSARRTRLGSMRSRSRKTYV